MMRWIVLFILWGQNLTGLVLYEALELSLKNFPGLKAEYEDVRIASARIDFARSGYKPTIIAEGNAGRLRFYDSLSDVKKKLYPKTANINIVQPLFRGGRTVSGIRRARYIYCSETLTYGEEIDLLLLDTATNFIDVLREQEVLKANLNNQSYLSRELQAVQDRFDVGDVTQTDLSQSKSRLAGADARVTESQGRLEIERATLEKLIGQEANDLVYPDSELEIPSSMEALIETVLCRNRQLRAQEDRFRAAMQAYLEVKGELYPELNLEWRAEHTKDLIAQGEFSNETAAFLKLTIPLYQAGRVYARLKEAAAVARKERFLYEELKLDLRQRSIQAWEVRETVKSQIISFEVQIEATQVALEGVKREESAGLRTVLDVLNAELEVLNATVNHIDARRNKFVAELEILHLMSRLYENFFCSEVNSKCSLE